MAPKKASRKSTVHQEVVLANGTIAHIAAHHIKAGKKRAAKAVAKATGANSGTRLAKACTTRAGAPRYNKQGKILTRVAVPAKTKAGKNTVHYVCRASGGLRLNGTPRAPRQRGVLAPCRPTKRGKATVRNAVTKRCRVVDPMVRHAKGSPEARAYMASIRGQRKPITQRRCMPTAHGKPRTRGVDGKCRVLFGGAHSPAMAPRGYTPGITSAIEQAGTSTLIEWAFGKPGQPKAINHKGQTMTNRTGRSKTSTPFGQKGAYRWMS